MATRELFVLQFFWFLAAWSVAVWFLLRPRIDALPPRDALSVWIAPQMFRILGLGLLVEPLAPGMPRAFAVPTAMADSCTAVLALLAVVTLQKGARAGRPLAWACTIVGSLDLAVALVHAPQVDAATHLHAQWYVPALGVPLMTVLHAMAWRALLRRPSG